VFTDVTITVEREMGSFGGVEVFYRTLSPLEVYPFLPGGVARASEEDYQTEDGSVFLGPGVTEATFNISIVDDTVPEIDETVFVLLTGLNLIQPAQTRPSK